MVQSSARRSRSRSPSPSVEYAASVIPGLEESAGDEIETRLEGARIIETQRGWVVFQYPGQAGDLLELRTTEDVFVLLYRSHELPTYRKEALPTLTRMARSSRYWDQALARFHQTRARSVKRVTYRVIAQMSGKHSYRRQEVRDAVLAGVQARWTGWKPIEDDAHLEVWVPVIDRWAAIAIRLSDRKMRHRTYKQEHRPASLRPTLAAAMVALSNPKPSDRFCDPMCGTGTILAERALAVPYRALIGGDADPEALRAARSNLSAVREMRSAASLHLWDARSLPIRSGTLDVVVCNLPFGKQVGTHVGNPALYGRFFEQMIRVLRPGGRAVLLTSEKELMRQLLRDHRELRREREILVGVLGQAARIYLLRRA